LQHVVKLTRTLGTSLRHLLELLDGAVEEAYRDAQLDYRPRYTSVLRALMTIEPASIKDLAVRAGLTHSAASQTVAQMLRVGLVEVQRGTDRRQQVVSLTTRAKNMIPIIEQIWEVVNEAARELDAELVYPLSQVVEEAIAAIEHQPFGDRIAAKAERRRSNPAVRSMATNQSAHPPARR
jgi:DNA-binding MarR family transcriptional regulator